MLFLLQVSEMLKIGCKERIGPCLLACLVVWLFVCLFVCLFRAVCMSIFGLVQFVI